MPASPPFWLFIQQPKYTTPASTPATIRVAHPPRAGAVRFITRKDAHWLRRAEAGTRSCTA